MRGQAAEFRRLAACFDNLASGAVSPHSDVAKHIGQSLEVLFRQLNEDWMNIPIEREAI
jgi:hypothetical protein